MGAEELMAFLSNSELWKGYNKYGLDQDLGQYLTSKRSQLLTDPSKFKALPPEFLYTFADSLRILAEKSREDSWESVLQFVSKYAQEKSIYEFVKDEDKDRESSFGMIAWFISALSENLDREFPANEIEIATNILIELDNNFKREFKPTSDDQFDVINSTRGKIYEAMIKLSLRAAKIAVNEQRWIPAIKQQFTERLHGEYYEFFWICGMNTPPISYLDMNWLKENYKALFTHDDKGHAAFGSYLLFSRQVYSDLFELFKEEYFDRINYFKDISSVTHKLISHIVAAYLFNMNGAAEMIDRIFEQGNKDQLGYVIKSINFEAGILESEKLISLWSRLLSAFEGGIPIEKSLLSETLRFPEHLSDLDEQSQNLFLQTIKFADQSTRTYSLINMLVKKIMGNSLEIGGTLLLALVSNLNGFSLDEEKINEIITYLYEKKQTVTADAIVGEMVKKRNFEVIPIYNKFHSTDTV
jgi:hypothetical protein